MNAAVFMLAFAAGSDAPGVVATPVPQAAPPAIVSTGASCSNCSGGVSTIAEPCGCEAAPAAAEKKGLFSRFKASFSGKKSHHGGDCGCEAAPAAPCESCAPAPAPTPVCSTCAPAPVAKTEVCGGCTATADPCSAPAERKGLFARLKGLCGKKEKVEDCGCEAAPACDGCAAAPTAIHSAAPAAPVYSAPAPIQVAPASPYAIPAAPLPAAPLPAAPAVQPAPLPNVPAVEPIAPPKETPNKIGAAPGYPNVTPVAQPKDLSGTNNPFDLPRRHVDELSHAADYSTMTGSLLFVHADGGHWVLRYASIAEEDRYGGRVVIARDRNMDGFREGDLVQVSGSIIREKTSPSLNAPLYRVTGIALKARGN